MGTGRDGAAAIHISVQPLYMGSAEQHCAGSVASLWQQAGRAGRREQASTSIYIAFDGPLDQYYFQHPQQLFGRAIEHSQVCDWALEFWVPAFCRSSTKMQIGR